MKYFNNKLHKYLSQKIVSVDPARSFWHAKKKTFSDEDNGLHK